MRRPAMAAEKQAKTNYYNDTIAVIGKVFDVLAIDHNATDTDTARWAIVEKQKMEAIFAFRKAYRTAQYDLTIDHTRG